ncbi:tyrosine-type recombinase/integrase [Nonomuraea aurantiaca]|uniref:tyrosine-type recombinase/integrase n=1 Tax=Nonomuraea aurantiaca TaxID=2878562 RepID=UPI001CDA4513|nr:site-specific integrase [Nonomuraea aurantiaca]MCA2228400.1 site-specific integrase [Nonomuraea aurantiaca]
MVTLGAGCGLRQGEIFGLAVDDVDFGEGVIHVRQQVKLIHGKQMFGLPKHDRERTVPLPESVAEALKGHLTQFPAREITLPWEELTGDPHALRLVLTSRVPKALNRNYINKVIWKPALERLGVIAKDRPTRKTTGRAKQTTREHGMHALRHYYASVLLDAGESVKALAEYLGHSDPGFTLRTHTHLMSGSDGRTRKVIDTALGLAHQETGTEPEQAT